MVNNPYQLGTSAGRFENDSTDEGLWEPFDRRFVRWIGLAKSFEAGFQVVFLLGSVWWLFRVGFRLPAGASNHRILLAYLGERFVILPALIGLNVYLARGLIRLRRMEVTILTIFAATVALFLAGKFWLRLMDVRGDLEEPIAPPWVLRIDVAWLLLDLVAALCHAAFSTVLFRARKALADVGDGRDADAPRMGPSLLFQLAAPPAALMLLVGSLTLAHDLTWELARQVFQLMDMHPG